MSMTCHFRFSLRQSKYTTKVEKLLGVGRLSVQVGMPAAEFLLAGKHLAKVVR